MYFEIPLNVIQRTFFFLLSKRSRDRIKKQLFSSIFFFIDIYLNSFGLKIKKLELVESNENINNIQTDKASIDRKYKNFKKIFLFENSENDNDNPERQLMLLQNARDEGNMSAVSYSRFRNRINRILGSYKLKHIKKVDLFKYKFNKFFKIYSNDFGCYVNARDKIDFTLTKIYRKLNGSITNNTFNLHLSGDGLVISKTNLNIITFVFSCINENNDKGLYTLGMLILFIYIYN